MPKSIQAFIATALVAALAGCGGGGSEFPLSSAHAQVVAQIEIARFDFILRPDANGQWFIQNDVDHASMGVMPQIEQGADYLRVTFDRRYTHAGVVQITSDDDFRDRIQAFSNLGVTSITIRVVHNGAIIDPAKVYDYVPAGAGNFWCSVVMLNKPKS